MIEIYYKENDNGIGKLILEFIVLIIVICIFTSCSKSCSRSERNMVYISNGYCYDQNTQIIYIESYTGRYETNTSYTPYYDGNGQLCKYNVETGEWIPVEK